MPWSLPRRPSFGADVVTGDPADIRRLLDAADASGQIIDV
jgi:hypothetical protein